jgi:hypothetical protein
MLRMVPLPRGAREEPRQDSHHRDGLLPRKAGEVARGARRRGHLLGPRGVDGTWLGFLRGDDANGDHMPISYDRPDYTQNAMRDRKRAKNTKLSAQLHRVTITRIDHECGDIGKPRRGDRTMSITV